MPEVICKFQIGVSTLEQGIVGKVLCDTQGVKIPTHEEVKNIVAQLSLELKGWVKPDEKRENVWIEVEERADSPRLRAILNLLLSKYDVMPCPSSVLGSAYAKGMFGVKRMRVFSKKDLDESEYLSFGLTTSLGHAVFRTDDQYLQDQYVTDKVANMKTDPAMGCLTPFQALVVMPLMRDILKKQKLNGLDMNDEVIGSKGRLYKLGSSIILPRSLTRLVNGQCEDVDPDVWKVTSIHGNTEDHLFDDGHRPCILRYRRADLKQLGSFDVAMTYEFIGNHKQGAYRGLIVSQRFREVLKEIKVRGAHFFPIQLE